MTTIWIIDVSSKSSPPVLIVCTLKIRVNSRWTDMPEFVSTMRRACHDNFVRVERVQICNFLVGRPPSHISCTSNLVQWTRSGHQNVNGMLGWQTRTSWLFNDTLPNRASWHTVSLNCCFQPCKFVKCSFLLSWEFGESQIERTGAVSVATTFLCFIRLSQILM